MSHFLYVSRYYEWELSLSQDALREGNRQYMGKNNSQIQSLYSQELELKKRKVEMSVASLWEHP